MSQEIQPLVDILPWVALFVAALIFFRRTGQTPSVGDAVLAGLDMQRKNAIERADKAEQALEKMIEQFDRERRELLTEIARLNLEINRLKGRRVTQYDTQSDRALKVGVQVYELMDGYMSQDEIQRAAFDLSIEWDSVEGTSKLTKAMNFITMVDRRGRMGELVNVLKRERPDLGWPEIK